MVYSVRINNDQSVKHVCEKSEIVVLNALLVELIIEEEQELLLLYRFAHLKAQRHFA